MRCELVLIAALAAVVARPPRARADLRVLVAADSYFATEPDLSTDDAADFALSAHIESRNTDRDFVLDLVDRESAVGSAPRRELHELSYVERGIPGLELTVGRFRVPGGFWLIADGAEVAMRTGDFTAGVFGGNRSFTNGRVETLLTEHPAPLPLVGATITSRGSVQAALSYTYTADRIALERGDGITATIRKPEQFLDAELATALGEHGFFTLGANAGSRYLVTYPTNAALIAAEPSLDNVWFGSQAAYAMLDWRLGGWRLDATVAALRTQLGQSGGLVSDPALAAIDGSYLEGTGRVTWRPNKAWKLDARYRARLWADGGQAHRGELDAEWRYGALDLQGRIGIDIHDDRAPSPGIVDGRSAFYQASIGRKTGWSELAVGAAAVSAIGDEVAFGPGDDASDQRAPYTLEARSYGFVRAFGTLGSWFAGLDGEIDIHGQGVRVLTQIGFGR